MYRRADPLALDPLGPIGIGPIADVYRTSDPLSLDPLSPIQTSERHDIVPRHLRAVGTRTRDLTEHSPRREQAQANAKVTT